MKTTACSTQPTCRNTQTPAAQEKRTASTNEPQSAMPPGKQPLAVITLWLFNPHRGIRMKGQAQDGGDAAALAAARWQGITST